MHDIEVQNLRKTFGKGKKKIVAVDDVSFRVRKGEIFGLLGVNGAGKTTTINMMTGLLKKDSGSIRVLGRDPEEEGEYVKNRMNVSTAYYPLSDVLSVRQNLRIYAKIYRIEKAEEKINLILEKFGLTRLADRKVNTLSSGQKTRTALCKGLINDPQVLFLDECTVGLDPDIAEKTRQAILDYQARTRATILFTSHYMHEIEELCDRVAFMQGGRIKKIATSQELKKAIKEQTIEITVKDKVAELKKMLEKEEINIIKAQGNTLIFQASHQDEKIYKVINKIFKEGFLLRDLHIKRPTLDDVFIEFARGKR